MGQLTAIIELQCLHFCVWIAVVWNTLDGF